MCIIGTFCKWNLSLLFWTPLRESWTKIVEEDKMHLTMKNHIIIHNKNVIYNCAILFSYFVGCAARNMFVWRAKCGGKISLEAFSFFSCKIARFYFTKRTFNFAWILSDNSTNSTSIKSKKYLMGLFMMKQKMPKLWFS